MIFYSWYNLNIYIYTVKWCKMCFMDLCKLEVLAVCDLAKRFNIPNWVCWPWLDFFDCNKTYRVITSLVSVVICACSPLMPGNNKTLAICSPIFVCDIRKEKTNWITLWIIDIVKIGLPLAWPENRPSFLGREFIMCTHSHISPAFCSSKKQTVHQNYPFKPVIVCRIFYSCFGSGLSNHNIYI